MKALGIRRLAVAAAVAALAVAASAPAWAIERSLTLNPFGLANGVVDGSYEQRLAGRQSLLWQGSIETTADGIGISSLGAGGQVRRYDSATQLSGAFIGAAANVQAQGAVTHGLQLSAQLGASGFAGYKWVLDSGLTLDMTGGLEMPLISLGGMTPGAHPRVTLGAGYSW